MIYPVNTTIVFKPIHWILYAVLVFTSLYLLASPYYLYAFLPSLIFLFFLVLANKPQLGFYIIIFLFPFRAFTALFQAFDFMTLSVQKFIGFYLLMVIAALFLLRRTNIFSVRSPFWLWFLMFFVISLISAFSSEFPFTSFNNLRALVTPYIIFLFAVILITRAGYEKTIPNLIIVSVFISAVFSIIGNFIHIPLLSPSKASTLQRLQASAGDPNFFASMIVFCIPFVVHLFTFAKSLFYKTLYFLCTVVFLAAVVLTYSRAGFIVFSLVTLLLFLSYVKKLRPRNFGFVISAAFLLLIVSVLAVPTAFIDRFKNISVTEAHETDSIGRRISYLTVGWEAFKTNPVIGSGPGTFRDIYGGTNYAFEYMKDDDETDLKAKGKRKETSIRRAAHNTYIEVFIGTGLLGGIVFIIIILTALRNFYFARKQNLLKRNEEAISLTTAYMISFISLVVYFMFLSTFHHQYFWLALGCSHLAVKFARPEETLPT